MITHSVSDNHTGKLHKFFVLNFLLTLTLPVMSQQDVYLTGEGAISFVSDAPLELIAAASDDLQGAIDLENKTFAFKIPNNSFEGFNSPLQQEHFLENYIEVNKYSQSTFQGKIIEDIDLDTEEPQVIRAKGMLDIHGVQQERIIRSTVRLKDDTLTIESSFTVPLQDHNIKIPRIVDQKIAELVEVSVNGTLYRK